MLKIILITIVFLQVLLSCQKEITYESEFSPSLVVNAIYTNEKPFSFRFSTTEKIFYPYNKISDSLHFKFYADSEVVLDTIFVSDSLVTSIYPQPFVHYSFELQAPDFEKLYATDSLPQLVAIEKATLKKAVGIDLSGDYISEAAITFQDPKGVRNYYELVIFAGEEPYTYWRYNGEEQYYDPVLLNEGDQDYYPTSYFFSDELFNGNEYTILIRRSGQNISSGSGKIYSSLRSVSKSYYLYRKYYTRHAHNQQTGVGSLDDFLYMGEPQNMYTNIENGFGIFAGFQETSTKMEITE